MNISKYWWGSTRSYTNLEAPPGHKYGTNQLQPPFCCSRTFVPGATLASIGSPGGGAKVKENAAWAWVVGAPDHSSWFGDEEGGMQIPPDG